MTWTVLIAHAKGEQGFVEKLADPICAAGYNVWHEGTVLVGESVIGKAAEVLRLGGPLVVCGTARAVGLELTHKLVNAAHDLSGVHVFVVQMETGVAVNLITLGTKIATYCENKEKAIKDLIAALKFYYPLRKRPKPRTPRSQILQQYKELLLESCNIIDLANLPENDLFVTTRHPELRWLYVPQRVRVETASPAAAGQAMVDAHRNIMQGKEEPNGVPIGRRLAESRTLVILGEPGAGKTTLLRWIATGCLLQLKRSPDWKTIPNVETLPGKVRLPIMVRCRDLDNRSMNGQLEDILCKVLYRAEITRAKARAAANSFLGKLEAGEAMLLIDGLDEIADPRARIGFCKQLERISKRYNEAPIIVTSRIVGYREMQYRLDNFEHVTLATFSKEDKDEFIRRWCNLSEPPERRDAATAELIRDIHSIDPIERLTGNPMLLTAMALVKRRFGLLRIRKVELYGDLLEVLLYWRQDVEEPLDKDEAIPQLEYLAYEMCERGVQRFLRNEIIELLEKMRVEYSHIHALQKHTPEDFIKLLERRTGILTMTGQVRHVGMSVPVYEFRHSIFREYLAARALVLGHAPVRRPKLSLAGKVARLAGRTRTIKTRQPRAREVAITENWREVLRLCVASCHDDHVAGVLLAILKPMKGEDSKTTARARAVLAALCLADEPNVEDDVVKKVLGDFVRQIGPNDGKNYGTGVDNAVHELASSRWAEILQEVLDQERKDRERGSDTSDSNVASLGLKTAMIQLELKQTASEIRPHAQQP